MAQVTFLKEARGSASGITAFTVPAGSNRVVIFASSARIGGESGPPIDVRLGGQSLSHIFSYSDGKMEQRFFAGNELVVDGASAAGNWDCSYSYSGTGYISGLEGFTWIAWSDAAQSNVFSGFSATANTVTIAYKDDFTVSASAGAMAYGVGGGFGSVSGFEFEEDEGWTDLSRTLNCVHGYKSAVGVNSVTGTLNIPSNITHFIRTSFGIYPASEGVTITALRGALMQLGQAVAIEARKTMDAPSQGVELNKGSSVEIAAWKDMGAPSAGNVLFSGGLPTLETLATALPEQGLLLYLGEKPVVTGLGVHIPDQGLLDFIGSSVDITAWKNAGAPSDGRMVFVGDVVEIGATGQYTPKPGKLLYLGQTVPIVSDVLITPEVGRLQLEGALPGLEAYKDLGAPSIGNLRIEGGLPTVTGAGIAITPEPGRVLLIGGLPLSGQVYIPAAGRWFFSGAVPEVTRTAVAKEPITGQYFLRGFQLGASEMHPEVGAVYLRGKVITTSKGGWVDVADAVDGWVEISDVSSSWSAVARASNGWVDIQ